MTIEPIIEATAETIEEASIPGETAAARFKRIASPRLRKAVKAISLLENCAGYGYEYTPDQVEKMLTFLYEAVSNVEKAFKPAESISEITL